jgi:hypothetical protein
VKTSRLLLGAVAIGIVVTTLIISGEWIQDFLEPSYGLSPGALHRVFVARRWGIEGVAAAIFAVVAAGSLLILIMAREFMRVRTHGRRRAVVIGVVVFIGLAVAADRVSLAVWRWRLGHYCEKLRREFALGPSKSQIIGFGPGRPGDGGRVPLVEILLLGPRPRDIIVDGNGGLNLMYAPPWLAWSRYFPYLNPRRMVGDGSGIFPFNDVYILRIQTVEDRRNGRDLPVPCVTLQHGLPP